MDTTRWPWPLWILAAFALPVGLGLLLQLTGAHAHEIFVVIVAATLGAVAYHMWLEARRSRERSQSVVPRVRR